MKHRTTASFGKRQEYIAVAELLRKEFDVYMTLVDDQQIDCIIRREKDGKLRYLDIQIKARSRDAKNAATFAALTVREPRPNFWFIFYSETINTYWIIPSMDLVAWAAAGLMDILLGCSTKREVFNGYEAEIQSGIQI